MTGFPFWRNSFSQAHFCCSLFAVHCSLFVDHCRPGRLLEPLSFNCRLLLSLFAIRNCCRPALFTSSFMATTIFQKDNVEHACTVRVVEEAEPVVVPTYQALSKLPLWPRILTAGLHIFVVLATAAMIGLLAHTLSGYSGTRGINFAGVNSSWPADLDLHPAVIFLVVASISLLVSLVWAFLTLFRLKRPSFSFAEMASVMLSLALLILWIAADFLEIQSELTPKRSLLSWACRRGSSPANVLVRYGSICKEQVCLFLGVYASNS